MIMEILGSLQLILILLLFLPAALGLGVQLGQAIAWDDRCITLALLLLCLDQARMATVDWQDIARVRTKLEQPDARLQRFTWVTLSTILIELIGFYLALGWLGWGVAIVLLSQLWFHGLAGVQLQPQATETVTENAMESTKNTMENIVTLDWRARSPILIANAVGLGLVLLWQQGQWPMTMALALLSMVLLYGLIKYGLVKYGVPTSGISPKNEN